MRALVHFPHEPRSTPGAASDPHPVITSGIDRSAIDSGLGRTVLTAAVLRTGTPPTPFSASRPAAPAVGARAERSGPSPPWPPWPRSPWAERTRRASAPSIESDTGPDPDPDPEAVATARAFLADGAAGRLPQAAARTTGPDRAEQVPAGFTPGLDLGKPRLMAGEPEEFGAGDGTLTVPFTAKMPVTGLGTWTYASEPPLPEQKDGAES